jgi:signal transduction histidine kinase
MRHLTVIRKLVFGMVMMLAVVAAALIILGRGLYATLEAVTLLSGRHEALETAAYELEINALETTNDAAEYLVEGTRQYRDAFTQDSAQFLTALGELDRRADTPRLRDGAARLGSLFHDLQAMAGRMMDRRDEQLAVLETTAGDLDQLNGLLHALRAEARTHPSTGTLRRLTLGLQLQFAEAAAWLGTGVRESARANQDRLDAHVRKGETLLRGLARAATTAREARIVAALRVRERALHEHLDTTLGLTLLLNDDKRQVIALGHAIDGLLDESVEPAVDEEGRGFQEVANRATRRALQLAVVLAPVLLAAGLVSTWWVITAVRRPVAALAAGVAALGRGQMDHRVRLPETDEFGELAAALNWMAERIQTSQGELRALSARIISLRESERKAISREIHDDLGQTLTAMKMGLSRLDGRCKRANDECPRVQALQHELIGLADSAIRTMRRVASGLRPNVLDHLGLVAAIEWQVTECERQTGIVFELHAQEIDPPLDDERATACFRVVQEALTNVVRHSGATRVSVRVEALSETLVLEVVDNGRGITGAQLKGTGSLGLLGMRERVEAFGGRMTIGRAAAGGVRVRVAIPRDPRAAPAGGSADRAA